METIIWRQLIKPTLLGRRYLRFFKFIPTLSAASSSVYSSSNTFVSLLETGKMGFLGLYQMLESSTIVSFLGGASHVCNLFFVRNYDLDRDCSGFP